METKGRLCTPKKVMGKCRLFIIRKFPCEHTVQKVVVHPEARLRVMLSHVRNQGSVEVHQPRRDTTFQGIANTGHRHLARVNHAINLAMPTWLRYARSRPTQNQGWAWILTAPGRCRTSAGPPASGLQRNARKCRGTPRRSGACPLRSSSRALPLDSREPALTTIGQIAAQTCDLDHEFVDRGPVGWLCTPRPCPARPSRPTWTPSSVQLLDSGGRVEVAELSR